MRKEEEMKKVKYVITDVTQTDLLGLEKHLMLEFIEQRGLLYDFNTIKEERDTSDEELPNLMFGYLKYKKLLGELEVYIKDTEGQTWFTKSSKKKGEEVE